MSALGDSLDAYLAIRRGLGTELVSPGAYLRRFVEFLDREGASVVTTALALRWATTAASPTACARRLADVRRFAAWLSATDPRTEVPPHGLLPDRYDVDRRTSTATRRSSIAVISFHPPQFPMRTKAGTIKPP